ncbi:transporter, AEC family [Gloeomargarita lithophora Alchichica-D10]|uniref:Transporter, AEC family n=1 Tax=Gloeomargarita lithophora Alchichica-D10 TaxID=1188229 RepID=A0A1J0ABF8_9CYAN|nr:AEC family transporter [Gloeomargarita lithophora]APB33233.1 transporter, AEC family [Gloeomargarita lithophora Alchichica-D10]
MSGELIALIKLYVTLIVCVGVGWGMGAYLPRRLLEWVGQFLFWVGVPVSVLGFVLNVRLDWSVWGAGLVSILAFWGAWGLGELWLAGWGKRWLSPQRGSFLLTSMAGNTGYVGYPVCLFLLGSEYFAWAVVFDLTNTLTGSYGLGVWLAARLGGQGARPWWALVKNPILWSALLALGLYPLPRPDWLNAALQNLAWGVVILSLVLTGVRLGQIQHWGKLKAVWASLGIKMLVVPLLVGLILQLFPLAEPLRLLLVLQSGMPPALATLILTEAYGLESGLTVSAIGLGLGLLLVTLPLWLLLFGRGLF